MTSARVARARIETPAQCIALSGKGVGSGDLEVAIRAVQRAARALRDLTRRRGHEWKPGDPEILLRTPAGIRGGAGWTVRLGVPGFVAARDVREAAEAAARHVGAAKNIRLVPLVDTGLTGTSHPYERGRMPSQIRRSRAGAPQHRARDLR
jgi:hypothetical protein